MLESSGFGDRLGECLRGSATAFTSRMPRSVGLAVTEVRADDPTPGPTASFAREDAFLLGMQLRDYPVYRYWEEGRTAQATALRAGDATLLNLNRNPVFLINNPFHCVQFYIPRAALDAIADSAEAARIDGLRYEPGVGMDDPVMGALTRSLISAFEHPQSASQLFIEHVLLAVGLHAATAYGGMKPRPSTRGGLAAWQEKRAKDILAANLHGDVPLADLARECGLSPSHFARAFRQSTGSAPHQWLLQRRVDAAKSSLRDRKQSLSEVALSCGFADQSHFTRVFTKYVGISPGVWRRSMLD